MNYDEFNTFCEGLPATTYSEMWGGAHVWKVGGKVFAIGGWEKLDSPAFTFKAHEMDFEILKDEWGFRPAPYLASRGMKWIQQFDVSDASVAQLKRYIEESHQLVAVGLTKKKQRELKLI